MLALVADLNPFTARADEIFERGVQVERVAHLVEISHLQIRALAHFAAVGQQFTQNQFQERGFARAVRADQTHFVAAQQGGAEASHDFFSAVGQRHIS